MRDSFLEPYLHTAYIVETEPPIVLRIGEQNPALDALLAGQGVEAWAFVTAWNPRSQVLAPEENARRQQQLEAELTFPFLPGRGEGDNGDWPPERSVLILGITQDAAHLLGQRWEQNAVVVGIRGGVPELLWCIEEAV